MTDARFQQICEQHPDEFVEYSLDGGLQVTPPTDPETSSRSLEIGIQLKLWVRSSGRGGVVTDPSGGFTLPNGSRLSPDAAWISRERLAKKPTCPEFVVELLSPTDRPNKTHAKMLQWIANGALLGWLINPKARAVTIFRPGREAETLTGITELAGEGPVDGFTLDLQPVWQPA